MKTILGLVLTLALGAAVNAAPISVGDSIRFFDREGTTGGGEFGVAKLPDANTELFRTFCLERTEHMDFKSAGFTVTGISETVMLGSEPAGDPLDPKTAYLYTAFLNKTLVTPYDYTPGSAQHTADANDLQRAIWFIENEYGPDYVLVGKALDLYNEAVAAGWTDTGNVHVLNLVWNAATITPRDYREGTLAQDVLYVVPEPSVMILMGLGLVGIGVARRRR